MKRREFVRGVAAAGAAAAIGAPEWLSAASSPVTAAAGRTVERLDTGWRFVRQDLAGAERPDFDDRAWEQVVLPHTARIEALVTGPVGSPESQWQGLCWYRRRLRLDPAAAAGKVLLRFEGAMNVADVWLDGERVGGHMGGWLPFVLDLSGRLTAGRDHLLAVRLDNRDNPVTGPKPLAQLDFNMYHGLYRPVYLVRTDPLHITDPILADRPASGGVFVTYPRISKASATVHVRTHVRNDHPSPRTFRVRTTLLGADGTVAARATSSAVTLAPATDRDVEQELEVKAPRLWSPASPDLYTLRSEIVAEGVVADGESTRIGIRRLALNGGKLSINGETRFLRGANRHQEYPYIGYALSDAAQYRDAKKIKDAGFDYIRLSHYAHSPAFMDACDELGLVVMDCIPGWQYFGRDPAFTELQYRNCRDLLRRDRNHPSVVLWEVSLNETGMPPEFIRRTHAIAHEEYPGDQCFTAGWVHGYDVFIQARQHGGCHGEKEGSPCLVSEYGDWEYYAMNAGLAQEAWQNLSPAESNSRQLRWQGEKALLQQAENFQEAHDDNRSTVAFADGLWVMYDYNRGYAPDIESSGCMDIFRLPKFSYWFFRSQRSPAERLRSADSGPMVFIASDWTPDSPRHVRVFSNCDEVALLLNGRLLERRRSDRDRISTHLDHPPFTFRTAAFEAGRLEAIGYIGGREATRHLVRTPGPADRLSLWLDLSGRPPQAKDDLFCYAAIRDAAGTVVPGAWENVAFGATGGATLAGVNPFSTEAGIGAIVVRTQPLAPGQAGGAAGAARPLPASAAAAVHALAILHDGGRARIVTGAAALRGVPPAHQVRFTTDGSEPTAASPLYTAPVPWSPGLRAALLVGRRVVATLAADAPRFRVPISAPPQEQRTPFRH